MTRAATIDQILAIKATLPPIKGNDPCSRQLLEGLTDSTLAAVLKMQQEDAAAPFNHIGRPRPRPLCLDCRHYPVSKRAGIARCAIAGERVMGTERRPCWQRRCNGKNATNAKGE